MEVAAAAAREFDAIAAGVLVADLAADGAAVAGVDVRKAGGVVDNDFALDCPMVGALARMAECAVGRALWVAPPAAPSAAVAVTAGAVSSPAAVVSSVAAVVAGALLATAAAATAAGAAAA